MCMPLETQPNRPSADERRSWSSLDEEETMVVLAGTDEAVGIEEVVCTEPTPKKRRSFLSALGRHILSASRELCCCGGGRRVRR